MNYELLAHTADVRVLARGENLEKLFRSALGGLCHVATDGEFRSEGDFSEREAFDIESVAATPLLIDFLSEALSLMCARGAIYPAVEFDELTEEKVSGVLMGYMTDAFAEDVKAVTYSEANIIEKRGGLQTLVVLDI